MSDDGADADLEQRRLAADSCIKTHVIAAMGTGLIPSAVLDAAAWAENIPFPETRDYVKKVLANSTSYAALISGQPQSLKVRLGLVGPRDAGATEANLDLP